MKRMMLGMTLGLSLPLMLLAGCSKVNNYTPVAGATGEDIFKTACVECHQQKQAGHYFDLDQEMANVTAIARKIGQGSFSMPAFPNIQGEALQGLSKYVLSQNDAE